MKKERLDALLTARGLFESRARAQAAIMAGQVLVNEQKIDKPGTQVPEEAAIRLLGEKLKYVSRGGLKLEKALQIFPISVEGKTVADIGASTGGFSDCALQNDKKASSPISQSFFSEGFISSNPSVLSLINMIFTVIRISRRSSRIE